MTRIGSVMLVGAVTLFGCGDDGPSAGSEGGSSAAETSAAGTTGSPTTTATTGPGTTASTSATTTPPADTTADGGSSESTDSGSAGRGEVRFVALGDAGEGNEAQIAVGQMIATVCEERGCDFALYLGDNFYDTGVASADDTQFDSKFQVPYAPVDLTFHITLGNHDYGSIGNEWAKSAFYIEYSANNPKFSFPAEYYSFQAEHVHFVSLDTSQIFWNHELETQRQWLQQDLAGIDGWKIVFGHHMYISNGEHGNAGNYEGLGGLTGAPMKPFIEDEVCGKAQVYICGHDHDRQWLSPTCGTEFIVSGAGAKLTDLVHRDDNPTEFEDASSEGFLWVEIIDDSFTGIFFDRMGNAQFERTITL